MTDRKDQKTIDSIKEKVLDNISSLGFTIKREQKFGKTIYSLNNGELFFDIIYASLNSRGEYFFGIEQGQFQKIYAENRNFFQIFICENENQVFIIPVSFMFEILRDAKATGPEIKQYKPIIKFKNGQYILRLFGRYEVTNFINRYDYLTSNKKLAEVVVNKLSNYYKPVIIEQQYKDIVKNDGLRDINLHVATIDALREIGEWCGFKVMTEAKIVDSPNFPYFIDCLWYKGNDLYLAIEVCDKGSVEKDKDSLKLAKSFGARKLVLVSSINKLERIRKLFMFNGEVKFWTEVWSFDRVFNMHKSGRQFFKTFNKFQEYSWKENLAEYL